jgi:uncharacterized protein (DUF2126 family)
VAEGVDGDEAEDSRGGEAVEMDEKVTQPSAQLLCLQTRERRGEERRGKGEGKRRRGILVSQGPPSVCCALTMIDSEKWQPPIRSQVKQR